MRAREFITEMHGKLNMSIYTLPNAQHFPDMDKYYEFYRFSMDMAQAGSEMGIQGPAKGSPVKEHPIMIGYSDVDQMIIDAAASKRGYKKKGASMGKSQEEPGANTISPVAKFKPIKKRS